MNRYSQKHKKFSPDNPKFWDFTIDDMIDHDLPSTIEFILQKTGKRKFIAILVDVSHDNCVTNHYSHPWLCWNESRIKYHVRITSHKTRLQRKNQTIHCISTCGQNFKRNSYTDSCVEILRAW